KFAENRLIYLTYTKPVGGGRGTPTLARGKFEGGALTDAKDLVVPDAFGRQRWIERARRVRTRWHAVHVHRRQCRSGCARSEQLAGKNSAPARWWLGAGRQSFRRPRRLPA